MRERKGGPAFYVFDGGSGGFIRRGPDIANDWGLGMGAGLLPEKDEGAQVEGARVEETDEAQDLEEEQARCPVGCRRYVVGVGDTIFSIARRLGVSVADVLACNPNLPDPNLIFPGQVICVPRGRRITCPPGFRRYIVRPGDTLFSIARRFNTTVAELLRVNPFITNPDLIFPGQIICVPAAPPPPGVCPAGCGPYVVGVGETIFSIAGRLGVSVNSILICNPDLTNPDLIFPGQTICVPAGAVVRCLPGSQPYTVVAGDTLFSIAARFGTTVAELLRLNPFIKDPNLIFPGQVICVPAAPPPPGVCPAGCGPYVVGVGETIFSIAGRLGVSVNSILLCNPGLTNPDLIFPGQTICVPAGAVVRCLPGSQPYTIVAGDTLFSIAARFGTTVAELLRANPFIKDPNLIFPGQVICVPFPAPAPGCPVNCQPFTVGVGDTIFSIARRLGVTVAAILACNPGLTDPNLIFPGQVICVPSLITVPCPPGFMPYTVVPGDTLFLIARRFGTTVAALLAANPQITNPDLIFPGQVICVPAMIRNTNESQAPAQASEGTPDQAVVESQETPAVTTMEDVQAAQQACPAGFTTYTVVAGDTLFFLARRFGTTVDALLRANPQITDPNNLMVGQTICVPAVTPSPGPVPTCPPGFTTHTVIAGETMFMIARRFGISLRELLAANPQITDPNTLTVGQVICVPSRPSCPPGSATYVVRSGDTMFSIAQRFGISLDALVRANPQVLDPGRLSPGDVLCIPPSS